MDERPNDDGSGSGVELGQVSADAERSPDGPADRVAEHERPAGPRPNVLFDPASGLPADVRVNRLETVFGRPARAAALPGVSVRWTALAIVACLVVTAIALPLFLHRSAWVEAEIVLLAWGSVWVGVMTWFAYTGRPLVDDTRGRPGSAESAAPSGGGVGGSGGSGGSWLNVAPLPDFDVGDGDGCAGAIVAFVTLVFVAFVLIVVVQFVLPVVVAVLYGVVRLMLGRVADHADETRGRLGPSFARALAWAIVYTAPLAIGVWLIHVVL